MPAPTKPYAQPWLQSPLRTAVGDLELAGMLHNVPGIDPASMRVLGCYALVLLVAGRGYYCDERGTRRGLVPGDAIVVLPEMAHAYGPESGSEWTQVYYVFGGPQFDLWRRRGLLRPEHPILRLGAADYWQQRLFAVLRNEPSGGSGLSLRALGRFLDVMAEMMAADEATSRGRDRDAWMDKALRLLAHRTATGWRTPKEVAREAGLSYENFRKRFAQLSGESPGHYQKRRRLDWACVAIYQGQHTLKQIAHELGFCDVFHFSKAFKQVVGTTPSDYRRRVSGR